MHSDVNLLTDQVCLLYETIRALPDIHAASAVKLIGSNYSPQRSKSAVNCDVI